MSDRVTADLDPTGSGGDLGALLHHTGDATGPLGRWRQVVRAAAPRGGGELRRLAGEVMRLIADPRVLFTAAAALRADGPKAPGPDGLRLEWLAADELWGLSAALGKAIAADTYRPGPERVVWVRKAGGAGRRPIVLAAVADRVVQKAAALVLRPLLDPRFDPLSFSSRVGRGREHAVAAAGLLAPAHPVWVPHDVRDAYRRVPVGRLLGVVGKAVPCPRLRALLARVLPPQARGLGGIKQGGPISALMLELYLTRVLHVPWRAAGPPARLLRYADDLLLVAPDLAAAEAADGALRGLLAPSGMGVKAAFAAAAVDIRERPAEWLGLLHGLDGNDLRVRLGPGGFDRLALRLVLAHAKGQSARRAGAVIRHWIAQLGPCYADEDRPGVCRRVMEAAAKYGFEEVPDAGELRDVWAAADGRWRQTRRAVRRTPGYFVTGPVVPPTPTSVVW